MFFKYIIFFIIIILIVNITFYRKCDFCLDLHKFKKINIDDLNKLYKLRQPIKFNHNLNTINTDNLDTIFNSKQVLNFNTETGKIIKQKWKKNKKKKAYLMATFKTNRNKEFKPKMCMNSYEKYIIMNKDSKTIPKYSNIYNQLITPITGKCTIRIIKNDEKNYLNSIKSHTYEDHYFLNDIYSMNFKHKEITLEKGECLLIPSKWIYSIKVNKDAIIFNQSWDTFLNKIAHSYEFIKYYY